MNLELSTASGDEVPLQPHAAHAVVYHSPSDLACTENEEDDQICFIVSDQRVMLSRRALSRHSDYFAHYLRTEAKDSREIAIRQARPNAVVAALHLCAYEDDKLFWQMMAKAAELWSEVQRVVHEQPREQVDNTSSGDHQPSNSKQKKEQDDADSKHDIHGRAGRQYTALLSPSPQRMTITTEPTSHTPRRILMSPLRHNNKTDLVDSTTQDIPRNPTEVQKIYSARLKAARRAHKHALRDLLSLFQSCLRFELRAHAYLTAQAIVDQLDATNVKAVWSACESQTLEGCNSNTTTAADGGGGREMTRTHSAQPVLYVRQACLRLMQPGLVSTPTPPPVTQEVELQRGTSSDVVLSQLTPSVSSLSNASLSVTRLEQIVPLLAQQAKTFHDELQAHTAEHAQALQNDFDVQVASIEKLSREGRRQLQRLEAECTEEELRLHEATLLRTAEERELVKDEQYEQELEAYWHAMERTRESIEKAMRVLQASRVMSRNERAAVRHAWLQLIEEEESRQAELLAALKACSEEDEPSEERVSET